MKLSDVVIFRKDLLFEGAVQLGWFERDRIKADKAASNFIFHGPDYHGVLPGDLSDHRMQLVDTASFTKEVTDKLTDHEKLDPFLIGIAGYGTGKSHLALTLATLYSRPSSAVAHNIIENLSMADQNIARSVAGTIARIEHRSFLVVALNGMEDFDLSNEIFRQVMRVLDANGLDTTILDNLRPRYKTAENFVSNFHNQLREEFMSRFGENYVVGDLIDKLRVQDESVFQLVNEIYAEKMGVPIPAGGQESLQSFMQVVSKNYCGPGKSFAGLLIIFDEFGRYIEFAAQKPHVAGPAALQQLFEAVQENASNVVMLAFVQNELKAYAARVMPERQQDIARYLTRFDVVRKVRLSSNLETVIANLLEKREQRVIQCRVESMGLMDIHSSMLKWFPEMKNFALWSDPAGFFRVVGVGCWPLHPAATWCLHRLTNVGYNIQQRSALSVLAEAMENFAKGPLTSDCTINPIDLLTPSLLSDFASSETLGAVGAVTDSYLVVSRKYQHQLMPEHEAILKAVLLQQKIGIRVTSEREYAEAVSQFAGIDVKKSTKGLELLASEYGILDWNAVLNQYEIISDGIPRRTFLARLEQKARRVVLRKRAELFAHNGQRWFSVDDFTTEFGTNKDIPTKEWNYNVRFTNISLLEKSINNALIQWGKAQLTDDNKGNLIYCYVGPESDLEYTKRRAKAIIKKHIQDFELSKAYGAPLAVLFVDDTKGELGAGLAKYSVLTMGFSKQDQAKFSKFIEDEKNKIKKQLKHQFSRIAEPIHIIFGVSATIKGDTLEHMLEQLFGVVYPKTVPFPFDGFSTSRGNAAVDCQVFAKELFLGNLDKEWLIARNERQVNRGHAVLEKAWAVFDVDGAVRPFPHNEKVRELLVGLDDALVNRAGKEGVNLGRIMRKWMAPPYGCSIACAGLVLSLYFGRRQQNYELFHENEAIKTEQWLGKAMPRNYFNLVILDDTYVKPVSADRLTAWEHLLNQWELETTHQGIIARYNEAQSLEATVKRPFRGDFRYKFLVQKTNESFRQQKKLDTGLKRALRNVAEADKSNNVAVLIKGAAELRELYEEIESTKDSWTNEQLAEIENHYATARAKVKLLFPAWLPNQKETRIEELKTFVHHMRVEVGGRLSELGLVEEADALKKHTDLVESNVRWLAEISDSATEVEKLVSQSKITTRSAMVDLIEWHEKAQDLNVKLRHAKRRTFMDTTEIDNALKELSHFIGLCEDQMSEHRNNAAIVFDHHRIQDLTDLRNWKREAVMFLEIFKGHDKEVHDLQQVIRQLDLLEKHYSRLSDITLTDDDLERLFDECQNEFWRHFSVEEPPLDHARIYKDIWEYIRETRYESGTKWVAVAFGKVKDLEKMDAIEVHSTKTQLEKMPAVLSKAQQNEIKQIIDKCEKRLDELAVDGLIARFDSFSENNKLIFLLRLKQYLQDQQDLKQRDDWAYLIAEDARLRKRDKSEKY